MATSIPHYPTQKKKILHARKEAHTTTDKINERLNIKQTETDLEIIKIAVQCPCVYTFPSSLMPF